MEAQSYPPTSRTHPPPYMCSGWLVRGALSLDEKTVVLEAEDMQSGELSRGFGGNSYRMCFSECLYGSEFGDRERNTGGECIIKTIEERFCNWDEVEGNTNAFMYISWF